MQRNISTQELKTRIGEVVDAVRLRGDRYIVQRRGKPVAALVPLHINVNYEQDRRELFALMRSVAQRNRAVPDADVEAAIDQALAEVRQPQRKKRRRG
jgi:prevent-host-death family protein